MRGEFQSSNRVILASVSSAYASATARRAGAFAHDLVELADRRSAAQVQFAELTDHPTTLRSESCLSDGNNRTLAAMIASGVTEARQEAEALFRSKRSELADSGVRRSLGPVRRNLPAAL
jgi:hypothetical protein